MAEVTALKVYTQQEVVDFPLSKDHKNSWERFLKDLGIFLSRDVSACKFRYKDEDNELVGLDTEMEWKGKNLDFRKFPNYFQKC